MSYFLLHSPNSLYSLLFFIFIFWGHTYSPFSYLFPPSISPQVLWGHSPIFPRSPFHLPSLHCFSSRFPFIFHYLLHLFHLFFSFVVTRSDVPHTHFTPSAFLLSSCFFTFSPIHSLDFFSAYYPPFTPHSPLLLYLIIVLQANTSCPLLTLFSFHIVYPFLFQPSSLFSRARVCHHWPSRYLFPESANL